MAACRGCRPAATLSATATLAVDGTLTAALGALTASAAATIEEEAPEQTSGGSWGYYSPRRPTDDDIRKERERLGILPRRKIERAAKAIAKRIDPGQSQEEIAREVARAKEYDQIMAELTARNQAAIEGIGLMVMRAIEAQILEQLREEDDAIAMLLMEM